ncbi:MAG TPA: DUF87 domain-containing protein [Stellaceae bacterium]|nr:DUF87 domain-containing protein [Stellaceae bacterium]
MTDNNDKIGRIVSVSGSQAICLLDNPKRDPEGEAVAAADVQTGTMVRIPTPRSTIYGMVKGVSVPMATAEPNDEELKIVELELVGERLADGTLPDSGFQRGVSFFPAIGTSVCLTTRDDLCQIYACPAVPTARVGYVHQDSRLPAYVKIDDLLGKHFAVLGTTGSGKSCAVTVVLKAILRENQQSRILLLDPHNEYAQAFGEQAQVLDPATTLELPYWLFNFDEICEVVVGTETDSRAAQVTILGDAIVAARSKFAGPKAKYPVTVDTPAPYWVSEVINVLQEAQGRLTRPESLPAYTRLISRLKVLSNDSRFSFMFSRASAGDKMAEILTGLFRIPVAGKPVTIVDLSGVPSEILNVVVSVLCRLTFDFAMWSESRVPILIVCEEAHRYAPQSAALGFAPTKRALAQIAKEGRKYGVSLCVVSQRPSDLAASMLSECNTVFALRMSNQSDQEFVRAAMSESGLGLLEFLPSLRTGEAIVVGEGVPVPLRMSFDQLPALEMPRGKTASFSESWQTEIDDTDWVAAVIDRWRRRQKGGPLHAVPRASSSG